MESRAEVKYIIVFPLSKRIGEKVGRAQPSTEGVMGGYVDVVTWVPITIFRTTFKVVHSKGYFNLFCVI